MLRLRLWIRPRLRQAGPRQAYPQGHPPGQSSNGSIGASGVVAPSGNGPGETITVDVCTSAGLAGSVRSLEETAVTNEAGSSISVVSWVCFDHRLSYAIPAAVVSATRLRPSTFFGSRAAFNASFTNVLLTLAQSSLILSWASASVLGFGGRGALWANPPFWPYALSLALWASCAGVGGFLSGAGGWSVGEGIGAIGSAVGVNP